MTLDELKRLAGVKSVHMPDTTLENMSVTGTEKRRIERERGIQPGTKAWFELWFSRPYWTGWPAQFRGRQR